MPDLVGSTPSQTIGPFLHIIIPWADGSEVIPDGSLWLEGRLTDGVGDPVPDGIVETWQQEPAGFGRCATDADGRFWFRTARPAAGYLDVSVFARGLLDRVVTRAYFGPVDLPDLDGPSAALLQAVETSPGHFRFDIRLRGDNETPFFQL